MRTVLDSVSSWPRSMADGDLWYFPGRAVPTLLLLACSAAAVAETAARVEFFSPEGTVKDVRQVTARFSEAMVAFGDPRLPQPFIIDCPAAGHARWADGRNWVYDFEADLDAGVRCGFTLRPDLRTLTGAPLSGTTTFGFNTGGPAVRASMPYSGDDDIDADQAFILGLDAAVETRSIEQHAACVIENVGERIPLDVLTGKARADVLAQRRVLGYQYFNVLWKSGRASVEKVASEDFRRAEDQLVVVRCRRQLPPATDVRLIWGAGIATPSGIGTAQDQVLAFRTRPAFTIRVECERVNARANCLPLLPLRVVFSAPITTAQAAKVRVTDADGRAYPPRSAVPKASPTVEEISFPGPFPEHARLTVALAAGLTDDAGRRPENGERFPLTVEFDGYPPLAKFSGTFGILESRTGGVLPVTIRKIEADFGGKREQVVTGADGTGARSLRVDDVQEISRWLKRVEEAMAPSGQWEDDKDKAGRRVWRETTGSAPVFTQNDQTESFTLPKPAGAEAFQVVGIPLAKPGFYVVELASPRLGTALLGRDQPRYVATTALVTNLAVHFKWGRESSLVWVTTLDGAEPVADAEVEVRDYCSGASRWSGRTDADGVARVAVTLGEPQGGSSCRSWSPTPPLLVSARTASDMSFTLSLWHRGIAPYNFDLPVGRESSSRLAHTVLDRPLFRAGETVSMKHYLRQHVMRGFIIPEIAGSVVEVSIVHAGSGGRITVPVSFDADGVAETGWSIPPDAKLGEYTISLGNGNKDEPRFSAVTAKFKVEQFRVPSMKAVVQAPAQVQVNPRELTLDLYVGYLSGGGAGNAPVKLRTQLEPRAVSFKHYEEFTFGGADVQEGVATGDDDDGDPFRYYLRRFGAYRDRDASGKALAVSVQALTLDAHGSARVEVPDLTAGAGAQSLLAELEYQDANGELLATSTRVPIWPAQTALGIRVEGWAGRRDKLRFQVVALDLNGLPAANRKVTVELFQRERSSFRKRLIGGFYAYETTTTIKRLATICAGSSDSHGLLSCEIAPTVSGELVLRARADDGAGNTAVASTTAWIAGSDDWWFEPGDTDRMDVLPESKEYESGDIARFQVRMPFRAATALVTVEREGVVDSFVTELSGAEPIVEVPIKANYAPNIYVSVLAVRGRVSWWRALLGTVVRYLDLPWPADGALPTALVDLSKPAYKLGFGRIAVGWKPHRLEVDVKPAQSIYNVREIAAVDIAVTRADGGPVPPGTEVALAAVDEGLLELSANDTWDLLAHMMGSRGLEVWTSTAQMQVIGKRHFGRKAVPHGGGGGRSAARERFETLLAWHGRVKVDDLGHARVEIPLNDSLTAFRIVAIAHAGVGHFGTGAATIHTTQDLMLHAGVPPLVRESDRYDAIFTVRNTTDRTMTVDASATTTPVAPAAEVHAHPAQSLTLAPGAAQDLVWRSEVPVSTPSIVWEVEVVEHGGHAQDHIKITQQVIPAFPVTTYQATLAQITAPFSLSATRPVGAISGRGGVQVNLRARLGDGLEGVREYMSGYSYVCLEQNLSRAIALRDPGMWRLYAERLPNYLDRDGLLRYFPSEWLQGSDTLTSYVLAIAHEAGWEIPEVARSRMLDALDKFVDGKITRDPALPTTDLALRKLAAIAALARYGKGDAGMLSSVTIEPNLWPTSAVLDWVDILRRVPNIAEVERRLTEASQVVRARLNFQGTTMGFSTERSDALWWLMVSGDVNATRGVLAFLDDTAWREDIPRMVRGALARQDRGHWDTTTANAWGVLAMEKFSAAFEATAVDGHTAVGFGSNLRDVNWNAEIDQHAVEFDWRDEPTTLAIDHHGKGRPWALVASRAALPLVAPFFTGYSIKREITALEQKTAGQWTRGDVARISLTIDAQTDNGWVVVEDPIPAGATILGSGLGRDAQLLTKGERRQGWVYPAYEERRFEAFRAYYRFVPKGRWTVEYTVRFNNPGIFIMPATRVEAMYAPEMFGELPNPLMQVAAP